MIALFLLACASASGESEPAVAAVPPALVSPAPLPPPAAWPAAGAPLQVLTPPEPKPGARPLRLLLDAGHGAPDNTGNLGVLCRREAEVMLELTDDLARRLTATGRFDLRLTRTGSALPDYTARITQAESWPADLILSLHSDARAGTSYDLTAQGCPRTTGAAGFSVLYGDELPSGASAGLLQDRLGAAKAIGASLAQAGFLPYSGADYPGLYAGVLGAPGVFVDDHVPERRIRMLRRPRVPSLILETHNATDEAEATRWTEASTRAAFAAAVVHALANWERVGAP